MLNYVIDDGGDRSYDPGTDDLGVDNNSRQELRPLIRDFLAYVTERNDYPIAPGGEEIVLTTPEGDPAPLEAAESTGASRVFVESNSLQEYSDSGKLTQFVGANGFVDKTRGKGGNELLPGVKGTGLDSTGASYVETAPGDKVPTVVVSALKAENKYTPDLSEQFVPQGTQASDLDQRTFVIPSTFGAYSTEGSTVTFEQLRKIGTSLLLKAAQIDTADTPNKSVKVEGGKLAEEALSPLDVFNSRKRIDTRLFDATRADGSPQELAGKNAPLLSTPADEAQVSYGTMNTPLTPFNGPLPAGMMAQAAVGIGIVGGGTLLLSTLLSLIPTDRHENPVRGPYIPGRSDVPGTAAAYAEMVGVTPAIFGLIVTRNPYIDCVKAGTLSFFGAGGGGVSSITGLAGSILQSPGYYVVIIRAILRSIVQIEEALKGFNDTGLSLQNLSAAVTFIDTIRRSRFIGYLNALAAVGDVLLDNLPSGTILSPESLGVATPKTLNPTLPANRVMTSREGATPDLSGDYTEIYRGAKGRLSWRLGSSAAAYLIPRTLFQGEMGISPTESPVMKSNIINKSMLSDSGRLPKQIVEDIESYLDAEYVPFYFHDLRTNEVIGFHAFLDALDDSYAVGYNSTSAFGRLDNVLQYGGTTRSLTFGFVIAATSEADFDEMWFRINKLVTLVYPQWSPGDEVTGASRGSWSPKYKIPFSQVVSASPLIRVRIGDVISSNYSKFGLSRFFGATDNETVLSDPKVRQGRTTLLQKRGQYARKSRFSSDAKGKSVDTRFYPPGSGFVRSMSNIEEFATKMPVVLKPSMGKNYTLVDGLVQRPIKTYFPIKGEIDNTKLAADYTAAQALNGLKGLPPDAAPLLYIDIKIKDERYAGDLDGKTVRALRSDFIFDLDSGPEVLPDVNYQGAAPPAGGSFFDSSTNAVVRGFETTQGRGIAGMITSLKFTWLDSNNTWEVTRGSRAPMWCKVSIGMDVIHDLPLGMAHDGFMIAPAYPVGNINRRFFGTPYTTPTEPYDKKIVGNEDLAKAVRDPLVLDDSTISPSDAAKSIQGG